MCEIAKKKTKKKTEETKPLIKHFPDTEHAATFNKIAHTFFKHIALEFDIDNELRWMCVQSSGQ